jgi:uncharacterized repeat protein (TIGR01451 family)
MKATLLLIALLFSAIIQAQLAPPSHLHPTKMTPGMLPKHTVNNTAGARGNTFPFVIDYVGADQAYANSIGSDYYYYNFLELNKNFGDSATLTHRYLTVNFDSLMYDDGTGNYTSIPTASAQLFLDSFRFAFKHTNVTANFDTIHLSVYDRDSVRITGTGPAAVLHTNTLWDTMIITDQSIPLTLPDTIWTEMSFYPQLYFARGKTFGVRVEYYGDTANKFSPMVAFRDDCANACAASPSSAGVHAYYYVNAISGNTVISGINGIVFSCGPPCNEWYLQNVWIFPYVTTDVDLSFSFDSDTFAFCNGSNILTAHVYAGVQPYTYAWSPTTGLSDSTIGSPVLQNIYNPVTYTLTVTDAAGTSLIDTVFVTPDQTYCSDVDTISGYVYFDDNNNGQKDVGELPFEYARISVDGQYQYQSDSAGYYSLLLQETSAHTLRFDNIPRWTWLSQPTANNNSYIITPGNNQTDKNFGVHVSADTFNAAVQIVNISGPPRPGFNSTYLLRCENRMGGTFQGEVQFIYDSLQTFISSSPALNNVNLPARTLSWNVANLESGRTAPFSIILQTSPSTPLGRVIKQEAVVIPNADFFTDCDATDNQTTHTEMAVGSYDPNDKSVSPVGEGGLHRILRGQELTYTIRFQNTGTFYAENVSVADTLDADLDMNTFSMVTASHSYSLEKQNNIVVWHFNNIMLLDSHTNEAASHGYIQYKIKPKANVSNLAGIENTAFIYFDFNEAVVTNTTSNVIDFYLNVNDVTPEEDRVAVYPNPFSDETFFEIDGTADNLVLVVNDIFGRTVSQKKISAGLYKYRAEDLSKGVYTYILLNESKIIGRGKLILQ